MQPVKHFQMLPWLGIDGAGMSSYVAPAGPCRKRWQDLRGAPGESLTAAMPWKRCDLRFPKEANIRVWLSNALVVFVQAYVILLAIYLLSRWVLPFTPWWLDLFDTFALYLFFPTVPLVLMGIVLLSPRALLLCVLPIAAFTLLYGDLVLPHSTRRPQTDKTFKVLTYNVLGMNRNFQGMMRLFEEEDPDVIALQELTPEIATPLMNLLSDRYRYKALRPRADFSGVGVFSRFPIKDEMVLPSPTSGSLWQHIVLDVRGRDLHLFNLHPSHPHLRWTTRQLFPPVVIRSFDTDGQSAQLEAMMAEVESTEGPIVALGDFNLTDQTRQYSRVSRKLTDSFRETGNGLGHTFPANGRIMSLRLPFPVVRIDYVFHSKELAATSAHLGQSAGSDHHPVVVELGFKTVQP